MIEASPRGRSWRVSSRRSARRRSTCPGSRWRRCCWSGMLERDPWGIRLSVLPRLLLESSLWAVPLLTLGIAAVEARPAVGGGGPLGSLPWQARLTLSIGAGVYEELLFRLILITAAHFVLADLLRVGRRAAGVLAACLSPGLYAPPDPGLVERGGGAPVFYTAAGSLSRRDLPHPGFGIAVRALRSTTSWSWWLPKDKTVLSVDGPDRVGRMPLGCHGWSRGDGRRGTGSLVVAAVSRPDRAGRTVADGARFRGRRVVRDGVVGGIRRCEHRTDGGSGVTRVADEFRSAGFDLTLRHVQLFDCFRRSGAT